MTIMAANPSDAPTTDFITEMTAAIRECQASMATRVTLWREAHDAYDTRGPVTDGLSIDVQINHLRPLVERQIARDMYAIHPGRPYIPLKAKLKDQKWRARVYERAIDNSMDRGGYWPCVVNARRFALVYGSGFVMPYIKSWNEVEERRVPEFDDTGNIVGDRVETTPLVKDALSFEFIKPWMLLVPNMGDSLTDKDYIIIRRLMPVSEIERRLDMGTYRIKPDISRDQLAAGVVGEGIEWQMQFEKDLDIHWVGNANQKMGVLCEYYSEKRWGAMWNYSIDLLHKMDTSPRLTNVDLRTKPAVQMKRNPGVGNSLFWGCGWWEEIRDKNLTHNLFVSAHAHKLLIDSAKLTLMREGILDPEEIADAGYGAMVAVDEDEEHPLADIVYQLDPGEPGSGMMEFAGFVDDQISRMTHQPDVVKGIAPTPKQTKGGTAMLLSEAQQNMGFEAGYSEKTYCVELAAVTTSIFASKTSLPQLADLVGWDDAMSVLTPDPNSIPGGYNHPFEGSDRVAQREQKFERRVRAYNFAAAMPSYKNHPEADEVFFEKFMEDADFDHEDLDRALTSAPPPPPPMPEEQGMLGAPMQPPGPAPSVMPDNQIPTPATNDMMGATP